MPEFDWRKKSTKHFGDVWFPLAQIGLRDVAGNYHSLAVQIDSGATVSLLRKSTAELLGLELSSGNKIDLASVGSSRIDAYLHKIPTRFTPEWPDLMVPYAIADSEVVPNLLGRLVVFDNLQVDFDASLKHTRITAKWLDDGDRQVWDWLIETQQHIYQRLPNLNLETKTREAYRRLLNRADLLLAALAGLAKLDRTHASDLIMRCLFEVSAQLEYIAEAPEERGEAYVEFEKISKKHQLDAMLNGPDCLICNTLRNSPKRSEGEARVNSEYDNTVHLFTNNKGNVATHWYRIQFKQLVDSLPQDRYPWSKEYDIWYKRYSGWLHGDPTATAQDDPLQAMSPRDTLIFCYAYPARMLLRLADQYEIILTAEQDYTLRYISKGKLAR